MKKKEGLVVKSTGSSYTVIDDENQAYSCVVRGKLRLSGIKSTNPIAVGDKVSIDVEGENQAVITGIKKRKNYLIRKSTNLSKKAHILAANIDRAVLVVTKHIPETTNVFIDRFLVTAEAYGIPVVIVFNKMDMYEPQTIEEIEYLIKVYKNAGYKTLKTSVVTNEGINQFKEIVNSGITAISGHSGVGKSSLLNKVNPDLDLKTGTISVSRLTGKHTTTFYEMHRITETGYIIDTPGIKGFGVIDIDKEELYHYFPEIFRFAKNCKYYNCLHLTEPGCAVKEEVEKGLIPAERYNSYLNLYYDNDDKHRLK